MNLIDKMFKPEQVLDLIGPDAKIVYVSKDKTQAAAKWPDGSTALLNWRPMQQEYGFNSGACETAAYSYAAGYPD